MNMPPKGTSKEKTGKTSYRSKQPDSKGLISYTTEENRTWHDLITRQVPMLPNRACPQWIAALNEMNFPTDRIPQLGEVSAVLREHTGWSVVPVRTGCSSTSTPMAVSVRVVSGNQIS